ncbi:MAG: DUF4835 family protein [Bacteroidales bacterium]|nr:DUF4835 family protein [Bacteroidales bacterium]MCD8394822.1 DUF4835 family protein [Bacteroidales bacterium]
MKQLISKKILNTKWLRGFTVVATLIFAISLGAQELNCTVEINSDQVSGTNKSVFTTLQEAMNEYMNTTKFTNAQFSTNEKIECRLFFTIKEYSDNTMKGTLQVQSTRPVYNTSYTTTLINFQDSKIEFDYQENEPLTFNMTNWESQVTGILNFYAYLILAVDFDSFSSRGGSQFYEMCNQVVQQAQSAGETGWKAFEDNKNRASVLSAWTDPGTAVIRDLYYDYHRLGLDEMSVSPDKGRAKITSTLENLTKVYNSSPMSVALSMFRDAKLDELVNIYTKGSVTEREKVVDILTPIYPTDTDRITKIKNGTNK